MKKQNYSYVGISLVILVFGIWTVYSIDEYLSAPDLATIGAVPAFSFTNQKGETITNDSYKGKVYIAEFFFTTCPSICPIMNRNMVEIQNEFYGNPNLGIASFSIDPEHDTPEVLTKYAQSYGITNPNWHLLTGEKIDIYALANNGFSLYVAQDEEVDGGFEHSGFFALIDKEGNIRSRLDEHGNPIVYYNGLEQDQIQILKEDIKKLL